MYSYTQTADEKESVQDSNSLIKYGECKFDLTKHGARLRLIGFGSRACKDMESNFFSTGKEASGIWGIRGNIKHFWGDHFYW